MQCSGDRMLILFITGFILKRRTNVKNTCTALLSPQHTSNTVTATLGICKKLPMKRLYKLTVLYIHIH